MKKVIIFGCGVIGRLTLNTLQDEHVLCFSDNDSRKWGSYVDGVTVLPPHEINNLLYDKIYVTSIAFSKAIKKQLMEELGVPEERIEVVPTKNDHYPQTAQGRVQFLSDFALYVYQNNISGGGAAVAECGVYKGSFAKEINRVFPDRTIYLFDTFTGFNEADYEKESRVTGFNVSSREDGAYALKMDDTSVGFVLSQLPHPEKAVVKKGYFPDTFDLYNETFCFVNLDIDLYEPTKKAIEIFYPLMIRGGIIVVHDYFSTLGARPAVDGFLKENKLCAVPIGDFQSLAIIKN